MGSWHWTVWHRTSPVVIYYCFLPAFKDVPVWAIGVPADWIHQIPDYAEQIYPDSIFRTRMNHLRLILSISVLDSIAIWFGRFTIGTGDFPLERGYLTFCSSTDFSLWAFRNISCLEAGFFHGLAWLDSGQPHAMWVGMVCHHDLLCVALLLGVELQRCEYHAPGVFFQLASSCYYFTIFWPQCIFSYYKLESIPFLQISTYLSGTLFLFAGSKLISTQKLLYNSAGLSQGVLAITLGSKIRLTWINRWSNFTPVQISIFQGHAVWPLGPVLLYMFLFYTFVRGAWTLARVVLQ